MKLSKRKVEWIVLGVIVLIVLFFMAKPFLKAWEYDKDEVYCSIPYCSKTTLNQFEDCLDIGYESSGFLSGNHYYLCDGVKVIKKCIEYSRKEFKGSSLLSGFMKGVDCKKLE